jgi:hypothetical protein
VKRLALAALLLLAAPLWGQKVELPAEVKAEAGQLTLVAATTDCGSVQWVSLDAGLSVVPAALLKDTKTTVVTSCRAGRYRLLAYGAKDDVASPPAYCTVVVGGAPAPPDPPGPKPPDPPPPADPLVRAFQVAYDAEPAADRAASLKALAGAMAAAAKLAPTAASTGQMARAVKAATDAEVGAGKLAGVRREVGAFLNAQIGTADVPMTADLRMKAAGLYDRVAKALEGVKP